MPALVEEWNLAGDDFRAIAGTPRQGDRGWQLDAGDVIECAVAASVLRAGDRLVSIAFDIDPACAALVQCEVIEGSADFLGRTPYQYPHKENGRAPHQVCFLECTSRSPEIVLSRRVVDSLKIRIAARRETAVFAGARMRRARVEQKGGL